MKKYENKKTPGEYAYLVEQTDTNATLQKDNGETITIGISTLKRWWKNLGEVEEAVEPETIAEPEPIIADPIIDTPIEIVVVDVAENSERMSDAFRIQINTMLGFVIWVGHSKGIDVVPEGRFAVVNGKKKLYVFPDAISIKESKAKELEIPYNLKHYCHQFKAKIDIKVNGSGHDADIIAEALK